MQRFDVLVTALADPSAFFVDTAGVAELCNPLGAVVKFPIGMTTAHRREIAPMLMAWHLGRVTVPEVSLRRACSAS